MIPPTIEEAYALYQSVPSLITMAGDASVKLRAMNTFITRDSALSDEFTIEYPQVKIVTLADGEIIVKWIPAIGGLKASALATQTVTIDGQEWPVALAMAILAAVYVREATTSNPQASV